MSQMDHMRKELQDYQVPVDTDKLWANTAHAIPHRRRRRGIVFWWMTGGMGVTAVMIALVSLAGGPASVRSDAPAPIQPEKLANPVTPNTAQSQDISLPTSAAEISVETQRQAISQPAQDSDKPTIETPGGTMTRQRTISQQTIYPTNTPSNPQAAPPSTHSSEIGIAAPTTAGEEKQADRPDDASMPFPETQPVQAVGAVTAGESAESMQSEADFISPDVVSSRVRADLTYAPLPMLPLAMFGEEDKPGALNTMSLPASPEPSPVGWERSKKKPVFYMTALQGIGLSGLSVRSGTAEGSEEASRWAGSMRGLEYLSSHLQGGIRLPSGLMAGLGIRYGQLTTEQIFTWQVTERITGEGTSVVIIGEDGSTESVSGEVITTRRSTFQSTRYNRHSTLDLDATLAYPVWRTPGFELLAWLRGGLNLRYDVTGSVPDAAWQPVRFDAAANPFRLASPLSWGGGLEARVRATRHLTLHARAGYDRLQYTLQRGGTNLHFHHPLSSISLGVGYVR